MKKAGDKIYFSDFTFIKGMNISIRRGIEWALAPAGHYLACSPWEDKTPIMIKLLEQRVVRFCDIPESWLTFLPGYLSLDGLFTSMKRIYAHFNKVEIVTVLFFKIVDWENIDEKKVKN